MTCETGFLFFLLIFQPKMSWCRTIENIQSSRGITTCPHTPPPSENLNTLHTHILCSHRQMWTDTHTLSHTHVHLYSTTALKTALVTAWRTQQFSETRCPNHESVCFCVCVCGLEWSQLCGAHCNDSQSELIQNQSGFDGSTVYPREQSALCACVCVCIYVGV